MPDLNIFRMLAHADAALVPFLRMTGALWTESELSPTRRELAILMVARLTEAEYEWRQHVSIALACGVTAQQVAAIEAGELGSESLSDGDRALLAMTEAIVTGPRASDAVLSAALEHMTERELVELHLVAGTYVMLARVMTNLDLEIDQPVADTLMTESERARKGSG
jgi:alkylhydroperoxidase family enzyme